MADLDNFVKLLDAQIKAANARVTIATNLVDLQIKAAKARQEVIKMHLENVAKFLEIQWDADARDDLLRTIKIARQKARLLQDERDRMEKKLRDLPGLMIEDLASVSQIRAGWIAFKFILQFASATALMEMAGVNVTKEMKKRESWHDPENPSTPEGDSFPALLNWARQHNAAPIGPAGVAFRGIIDGLTTGAETELTELATEAKEAEESAVELAKIDWARIGDVGEDEGEES